MTNVYTDMCLTVQALRRAFEGIRTPLAPAIGISASIYTHQVANVFRVLTDIRVRHLLADEVGLGKTVQALMILNALRHQRKDLRALVVVPDRLVPQWRDEILTRAHSVPMGVEEECDGPQYIRLAWEDQLRRSPPAWTLADIDPNRYDVLVVDELHRLRSDLQDRLVRVARRFEHLLLLTATPAFQEPQRHAQLFAMLEPERYSLAANANEQTVVERILELDRNKAQSSPSEDLAATALAYCAYRRVVRTRRADYTGVLPTRKHIPILTEPLGAEKERQALMWKYFGYLDSVSLEVDPVKLAKRVILSPASLEQRVDFLRRKGHDRKGLLERAKPLVHRSQGDSRTDALIDLLAEIWVRDCSERVLVAAQDNLTVDYLFEIVCTRLPKIGPIGERIPLVAARIRQGMMTEAVEDLGGYENETNENLEEFQRGEAQVLFAPDAAQVGLNLQCSRILILYSVPWKPEEMEQWIGRLDRIGNTAAFVQDGEPRDIEIYTIAQQGLVDEKVVTVLQGFHAFERSINLDGEHLEEVASLIESAALKPETADWHGLEDKAESLAIKNDLKEFDSNLWTYLPWGKRWALSIRDQLDSLPPAPLAITRPNRREHIINTGPYSWDRGVEGMLKLLRQVDQYSIRLNYDPEGSKFLSIWYRFGRPEIYGKSSVASKIIFSFGANPVIDRHPRNAHAFITRRGDIAAPPRRHVTMTFDEEDSSRRPLHFFNFGSLLHDELVDGWLPAKPVAFSVKVFLPADHVFFESTRSRVFVIRIAILDPAFWLKTGDLPGRILKDISKLGIRLDDEKGEDLRSYISSMIQSSMEADIRWMRAQLTANFLVHGYKYLSQHQSWRRAEIDEITALLNPIGCDGYEVPRGELWRQSEQERNFVNRVLDRIRSEDTGKARDVWSYRFPRFEEALESRLHIVQEETKDAAKLSDIETQRAKDALSLARAGGNRGQITRAKNGYYRALDMANMTRVLWQQRENWLKECLSSLWEVPPEERLTAALVVERAD